MKHKEKSQDPFVYNLQMKHIKKSLWYISNSSRTNNLQSHFLNICHMIYEKRKKNIFMRSKNNTHGVIWKQRWKVPNSSLQKVNPCIKTKLDRVQRFKRSSTGKRSRQQRAVGTGSRPLRIFAFRFTGSNGTHDGSEDDGEHWASRLLLKELIVNDVDYTLVVVSRWY